LGQADRKGHLSRMMTIPDHLPALADQPMVTGDGYGAITIGRRGYCKYGSASEGRSTSIWST
jgi:hypothetical protein